MDKQSDQQTWKRPQFVSGGDEAYLLYAVFGEFPEPLNLSASQYRSNGIPEGTELILYKRGVQDDVFHSLLNGWVGQSLRDSDPSLADAVANAPSSIMLRGSVADPKNLLYLKDAVGMITALLDAGGIALLDTPAFAWFSPERWYERIFEPNAPVPRAHVSIFLSPEQQSDQIWVHTRGMRKFGRPDISMHNVASAYQDSAIDLCNRFIEMMSFGAIVPEGQSIRMSGLPDGLTCHHAGDFDDPDFNNVHLEIVR